MRDDDHVRVATPAWVRRSATAKHIIAGTSGGVASTLVCHPLDTIRTRAEGPLALYRGLWWPLCAQGAYKAIMFGVFGWATTRRRAETNPETEAETNPKPLSAWDLLVCGGLAGGANALVLTPVELVRNRQQVGPKGLSGLDVCRDAARSPLGALSLWRGLGATLCRDGPGVGMYYATFELAKRRTDGSLASVAAAGALGGAAYWTVALPFDHVKSRIQCAPFASSSSSSSSSPPSVLALLRTTPLSTLYVGYGAALARGVPGAAVVFATYDRVFAWLSAA